MKNVQLKVVEEYEGTNNELLELKLKNVGGHLVFDIKLGENFRRKAQYVAEGYKASTPSSVTFSSVVKRDLCVSY